MKYSRFSGKRYTNYVPRYNSYGDYTYGRNGYLRPDQDDLGTGDWDDRLTPEERAQLMGRDSMGNRWK